MKLILDVATTPIIGAEQWLPAPKAAANLRDPLKISADLEAKSLAAKDGMGLDLDLCRISALGWMELPDTTVHTAVAVTEADEADLLKMRHTMLQDAQTITFNGISFDLPLIERRLLYLGLPTLGWSLDRFKSNHIDLLAKLSDYGKRPYRSLGFYVNRLNWVDLVKPLSGAQEATALKDGKIEELRASVAHDVIATYRLAQWMRVIAPAPVRTAASEEVDL